MFTVIAAIISAVVGMVSGIIKSNAASFSAMMQANQGNVDFARGKEMTYYNAYIFWVKVIGFILLGGLVIAGVIYYTNK